MAVTIRTATLQDLEELGADNIGRAGYWVAAVENGRVLGAGGMVPVAGKWVAACLIRPEVRAQLMRYRRPLLRAARATLALARGSSMPVYAEDTASIARSGAFLEHLGFRRHPAGGYLMEAPRA